VGNQHNPLLHLVHPSMLLLVAADASGIHQPAAQRMEFL
jgi:hypothetical protein